MVPPRLKPSKKSQASKEPVTKDDHLEVADEHEKAMGKHRAGDPAKALRFADRALDVYTKGLAKFPRDFELAHFKAKLELEKATDPWLIQVPGQSDVAVQLFRQSVSSHRYALGIDPSDADTLFNMAQAMTGLAEAITESNSIKNKNEALQIILEALETQRRCFDVQQKLYQEVLSTTQQYAQTTDQNQSSDIPISEVMQEEEEVQIIDAVNASTLLDTVIAQTEALSLLCSFLSSATISAPHLASPTHLPEINAYKTNIEITLQTLLDDNREILEPRLPDIFLPMAVFMGNYLELALRFGTIDRTYYEQELSKAFSKPGIDITSKEALLASDRALLSFNSALSDRAGPGPSDECQFRWKLLWEERARLTSAVAGMPEIDQHTLATTHMLRGDISLLLQVLAYPPTAFPTAISSASDLLKAASTYYRNASKLFAAFGPSAEEEKAICDLRGGVVTMLQQMLAIQQEYARNQATASQDSTGLSLSILLDQVAIDDALKSVLGKGESWVRDQVSDMVSEGSIKQELFPNLLS
ncbi:hypothetical protein F5Y16DRAFT_276960 [Xylariaceae sp. FL0255]|nr:hypothetical protein F5Y16DRAFT_276960 [Xylariaceae sp. FL0255]